MNSAPSSWTESEERTRTWWGIMILDRYVSLAIRGRKLSTPNPDGNQYVPVDDATWGDGFKSASNIFNQLFLSFYRQVVNIESSARKTLIAETLSLQRAGIFEREAHASYLLGQVVNLKLGETFSHPSHIDGDQLSTTLQALSSLLRHDVDTVNGPYYCAAVGICNSALIALHTPYTVSDSSSTLSPPEKIREFIMCKRAANRVYELGVMFFTFIDWPGLMDIIAPLVPDSIYQAGVVYGYLARKTGDPSYREAHELMRRSLKFFDRRWKFAGSYLQLLDTHFHTLPSV